ncbi:hypothetical protein POM88_049881 [Heracleum sosnowskyi]|uniref:Uncharacterized protein n=1 Tax=Heracleum sosnowskyi TaxID=360622 RepID=A0AAD8LZV8_9APIA|nr:hypothetical protein POM88_049881 [Heracleum sosnowskyi]
MKGRKPVSPVISEKEEVVKRTEGTSISLADIIQPTIHLDTTFHETLVESKDDYLYQADIQEYSEMDLFLDEITEVRGIDRYKHLPERLVFLYKSGVERTWL